MQCGQSRLAGSLSDMAPGRHNRQSDQPDRGASWARVPALMSVVKVGSEIETSQAIVEENCNVFVTDRETRRLRYSE